LFTVNASNQLVFTAAPDFEAPLDVGANNVYNVDVRADDGNGGTTTQSISVTVNPVNESSPVFTSSATPSMIENQTVVQTLTATDADLAQTITFTIAGTGADDALFSINGSNQLVFNSAPDTAAPADANSDNVYEVDVTADDGNGGTVTVTVTVTVKPAPDLPPVTPPPAELRPDTDPPPEDEPPPENDLLAEDDLPLENDPPPANDPPSADDPPPLVGGETVGPPPAPQDHRPVPSASLSPSPSATIELPESSSVEEHASIQHKPLQQVRRIMRQVLSQGTVEMIQDYVAAFNDELLWNDIGDMRKEMVDNGDMPILGAGTAVGVTGALTVGYVLWTIRSGLLVTSLLAQMPAWRLVDPLVVLDYLEDEQSKQGDEDDSIESMLERNQSNADEPTDSEAGEEEEPSVARFQ
ncbi:MAG: hypothetical protein IIA03_00875, partial [Proteobacteria bacterium]|nr:hypothetical protein [Pseudomonadota bacterium]